MNKFNREVILKLAPDEIVNILKDREGFFIVKDAFDPKLIDSNRESYYEILSKEKWDHSRVKGTGKRIWRSLEKLALMDPHGWIYFYCNSALDHVFEAWLGPLYQLTAQINIINQDHKNLPVHFDYHFGMLRKDLQNKFPDTQKYMNQFMTLQAIVPHSNMNFENGGTRIYSGSQKSFVENFNLTEKEVESLFCKNAICPNLNIGDVLFLNSSLLHAGGVNKTSEDRIALLIQASSAFGIPMEQNDYNLIHDVIFENVCELYKEGKLAFEDGIRAIRNSSSSYLFPVNFDEISPRHGILPFTQTEKLIKKFSKFK